MKNEYGHGDDVIRNRFPALQHHEGSWVVIRKRARVAVCEIFRSENLNRYSEYLDGDEYTILPFIEYMMALRGASDDGPIFGFGENRNEVWRGKGCGREEYNFVSCNRSNLKAAHIQMRMSAQSGDFKINRWDDERKEWKHLFVVDTNCVLAICSFHLNEYVTDRNDPYEDRMKETNLFRIDTQDGKKVIVVSADMLDEAIQKAHKLLKPGVETLNLASTMIATSISITDNDDSTKMRKVIWSSEIPPELMSQVNG